MGIVDEIDQLTEAVFEADLVVVSVPVDKIVTILPQILDVIGKQTTVTDVGSTKVSIVEAVLQHPNRSQYVAAHPMSGTENSGPQAALEGLFCNKTTIICDKDFSAPTHVVKVEQKEDRQVIVELAGGGFRDASRLAKSSPEMWTPIFEQNKRYLLEAIAEYSKHLQQMQQAIADDRWDVVFEQIKFSNKLRDILKKD